jgi:replicative DNA helicase
MPDIIKRNTRRKKSDSPVQDELGRLQPQAVDFEAAVLGAILIEQDAYSLVSELLKPESFYD